jgi:hypothetical protein
MKGAILISVLITTLILFAVLSMNSTEDRFKQICDKSGGTTVWDGRQYQCLPAAQVKSK